MYTASEFLCTALDDAIIEPARVEELLALLDDVPGGLHHGPRLCWAEGGHNIQKTHAAELASALTTWIMHTLPRGVPTQGSGGHC